ncbi:MAG: OmpA/MotB family protein [Thermoguttaceae bacterium]
MAREKPPEAGVPEWILTYGDMMSLLLCFFIMLYAISTVQIVKVEAAIESLQTAFGYQGASKAPQAKSANASKQHISTTGRAKRRDITRGGTTVSAPQGENPNVQSVRTNEDPIKGGILLFPLKSDELSDDMKKQLDTLLNQLIGSPYKILITGHAGSREIGVYRDANDLAYARAMAVRDYFVNHGLNPDFFRLQQVGGSEPLSRSVMPPAADPAQMNSYVEIKLLSDSVRNLQSDKADRDAQYIDSFQVP